MINIYKQKLTKLQQEILRLLFIKSGNSLNQLGIAKILGVSQPAVIKALPYLEKADLIKVNQDKESKRWSIELNRDNHKAIQLKRVDNLKQIYETGFADFLEREFAGGTIILFGSYSRGEDNMNSDIDFAIIGRKEKEISLVTFEKMFGKRININFYSSFKEIHKDLRESILSGIVLSGGIEL
jgi:predicted nucleotidyltransferase